MLSGVTAEDTLNQQMVQSKLSAHYTSETPPDSAKKNIHCPIQTADWYGLGERIAAGLWI